MVRLRKAHLVFDHNNTAMIQAISRHCIISGRDSSLEQAAHWAKKAGGEDPDIFLINSRVFPQPRHAKGAKETKALLQILAQIRQARPKSRVVLLFPRCRGNDEQLIAGLLKINILDFWFEDDFDESDIQRILTLERELPDVEGYLASLEIEPILPKGGSDGGKWGRIRKIYEPYFVKSNIVAFYSRDDSFINQGLALLTAVRLAENGFKVALVEALSETPLLAASLSLSHPFCNTRHALSMYIEQDNEFIKECLFNNVKYKAEGFAQEKDRHFERYPAGLYFLPDGIREDNAAREQMEQHWRGFSAELARIVMFEKDFNFLIFCCCGETVFAEAAMQGLAYRKYVTVNMLPGSIAAALRMRKQEPGAVQIIGTKKVGYLLDELQELEEEPFFFPPDNFAGEFLDYIYMKSFKKISAQTWNFIDSITAKLGVRPNAATIGNKAAARLQARLQASMQAGSSSVRDCLGKIEKEIKLTLERG